MSRPSTSTPGRGGRQTDRAAAAAAGEGDGGPGDDGAISMKRDSAGGDTRSMKDKGCVCVCV